MVDTKRNSASFGTEGVDELDLVTAVHTPMSLTPVPSAYDLHKMRLEDNPHEAGRSPLGTDSPDEEKSRSGGAMEAATSQESALRDRVKRFGKAVSHLGSNGVLERREVVDLGGGAGPEEVIIIDWREGDPEVRPTGLWIGSHTRSPMTDTGRAEPVQLADVAEIPHRLDSSTHHPPHRGQLHFDSHHGRLGSRAVQHHARGLFAVVDGHDAQYQLYADGACPGVGSRQSCPSVCCVGGVLIGSLGGI